MTYTALYIQALGYHLEVGGPFWQDSLKKIVD